MEFNQKKVIFIRGDLNAFHDGVIPLRNTRWIELIKKHYGPIHDGLRIWLYEETQHDGKIDPTIFPGIIKDIGVEDEYEIQVDEKDMQYLSESKKFQNYSVADVVESKNFY